MPSRLLTDSNGRFFSEPAIFLRLLNSTMNNIRQWIAICEEALSLTEAKRVKVGDITVWMNPNVSDLKRLLAASNTGHLRASLLGDLYVWDAYYAVHSDVQDQLDLFGAAKLMLYQDSVEISYRDDPDSDVDYEDDPESEGMTHEEYIANHPAIIRAYGHPPEVWSSVF